MLDFFRPLHPSGITFWFYTDTTLSSSTDTTLSSIQQAAVVSLIILYQWFSCWRLVFYSFHLNLYRSLNTALFQQALWLLLPSLHHWFIFMLLMKMVSRIFFPFFYETLPNFSQKRIGGGIFSIWEGGWGGRGGGRINERPSTDHVT